MLLPFCMELLNTHHSSYSVCAQHVCPQQYEVSLWDLRLAQKPVSSWYKPLLNKGSSFQGYVLLTQFPFEKFFFIV